MPAWRMAFRDGNKGFEMWNQCLANGVAAIAYGGMDFDLSKHAEGEPARRWSQLSPAQHYSLTKFAYEIKAKDRIYVKQGSQIVGKGRVSKPYFFTRRSPVKGVRGDRWPHLMSVEWDRTFLPVRVPIGGTQMFTIRRLFKSDLLKLTQARVERETALKRTEAIEGAPSKREAQFRKRNAALIAAKKAHSDYRCEVCTFNFEERYGSLGREFIVAHHVEPIGSRRGASRTSLNDIKLVCANCHAMIHKEDPPISLSKLRAKLDTSSRRRKRL